MSKRQRKTTQTVIDKRIKEGRGKGHFTDYKPWLTIHDVPSQGVVTRILGWKSGRLHHYFSEHFELAHHYQMEWALNCADIREQFPLLPLEKTLFIADKLGIKHPVDPKTKNPIVMTTDMLLSVQKQDDIRFVAHTIKPKSKLNKRVLEKFEIEKRFFKDSGIDWALITEAQINYELVKNVEWLHSAKGLDGNQISKQLITELEPMLYKAIQKEEMPLAKTTLQYDESEGLDQGTCMFVVRHLIANRFWGVDMNKIIVPTLQPLKVYKNNEINGGSEYE
ncbi:TnsA endonuclease N-terminal domain-containing protein [Paenibacillus periandrae]|uniref:TnsA endonuclease N-terminal domain-containing protein n=1 Tax=Paenibacillus periandrae TaxID=1761741 RepID=UPI001F099ACF|nr:TnsA endonuclease N-terminal domain-containing protein [Paenibacillus periandrae]